MNQTPKRIHPRKRRRVTFMLWAYLAFHMRKVPAKRRELQCWMFLLHWASLGGKPDEVINEH